MARSTQSTASGLRATPAGTRGKPAAKPAGARERAAETSFPIIGIGASAGGLEALEQFLGHVPGSSDMAFVVVQHLDPERKGMLPELLQRHTPLPVMQVKNRMKVQPGHVYVIPPNRDLSILHDSLFLLDPVAPRGLRLPIDYFFRALAEDRRGQAVGVVLSGMGSDGTLGLRAIKEQGGLALAQDPVTAKFDGMPRSVIDAGLADIVAHPAELPGRIGDYLHRVPHTAVAAEPAVTETAAQRSSLDKVCILLRAQTGHDFSLYKRNTLYRRIARRMAIHQIGRIGDYVRFLNANPQETDLLFKELLIGVTSFFRDPPVWDYLQQYALPDLLAACEEGATLRAWTAGCSTGEEAYSLAIAFHEVLEQKNLSGRYSLQIFATDIDRDAIDRARRGVYPPNIAADVSPARLARYFIDEGNGYRVSNDIRQMVVFAPQSVITDPPFTRLDLLSCRNLLIYLGPELQRKLFPLFYYSLKPGGVLLLGSAESIGEFTELFVPLDRKKRVFRRNPGPSPLTELPFPARSVPHIVESSVKPKSDPTPPSLQTLADQLLAQAFAPAAVLVNRDGDLLYINGRTGKYLEPAAGKVNWNIHAMARDGLRQEIALALPQAFRSGERVVRHNLQVSSSEGSFGFDLTIQPISDPPGLRGMAMLVFTDALPLPCPPSNGEVKSARGGPRETELEQELLLTRHELLSSREEMQASQEELKSANEELQSTNEELQSTNEELTTSKEEMQSLNEELQTVNSELQNKVDDLSATSNDMKNLLNSTDIATIFLDNALSIRRYTTQAASIFKLIPGDIGRPLFDLASDLDYAEFADDAREVLDSLALSQRQISARDGRWFEVRIMPYRTTENVIDGLVITFVDITVTKRLEQALRQALGHATE